MSRFPTPFTVYNTLTRATEVLSTKRPGVLSWYICGPTVYANSHIGHARSYVSLDFMHRVMKRYGGGLQVQLIMGITDVDDKIIARAANEATAFGQIAQKYENEFFEYCLRRLNIVWPQRFTRVSEHIKDIIAFIEKIVASGMAYVASDGSVYFSLDAFQKHGFSYPKFRPLVGHAPPQTLRHTIEIGKRHQSDFALWKAQKTSLEPSWKSPWGDGRPGWHIECSAMIDSSIGEHIDLHSGGMDLEFPHHENEIAQSEAYYGASPWCPFFLHTGHLRINDQKMSKSLHNFVTIQEMLMDYTPDDFRMLCLSAHYRSAVEYTEERMRQAAGYRKRLYAWMNETQAAVAGMEGKGCDGLSFGKGLASRFSEDELLILKDVKSLRILRLGEYQKNVEQHLMSDFNWKFIHQTLFASVIERIDNYRASNRGLAHPLILIHALDLLAGLLDTLGFSRPLQLGLLGSTEVDGFVGEAVTFRGRIRQLALSMLRRDGASERPTPESKESRRSSDALILLELCDLQRKQLASRGIIVKDDSMSSSS